MDSSAAQIDSVDNASSNALKRNHMPLKDKLILGPMEKYKMYNRFPWKLLI